MDKYLAPWTSPNGTNLPANLSNVGDMAAYINALTNKEVQKIVKAFQAEFFDMSTEYTWNRTINVLREKVLSFGKDFVLDMLGRSDSQSSNQDDFLSEVDIINLSADLGFINKTAKMQFLHCNEFIKHFSSRDVEEEMDIATAQVCIRSCVKYVLSMKDEKFDFEYSFAKFRDNLKATILKDGDESLGLLFGSPYFYKRTVVRVLLSLIKKTEGAELENVFANMSFVVPKLWDDLLSDDRRPFGAAYARAVSDSNKKEVLALKTVLLKVKGFDYVPENLRSNTFIEAANHLLKTHFATNNFYNEPDAAKKLFSLGTAIPSPALGVCLTATLACKLGNQYGIAWDAQSDLDSILGNVSIDRWDYYINQVLPADETILYKLLSSPEIRDRWIEIAEKYNFGQISGKDKFMIQFVEASVGKNNGNINGIVKNLLDKVRPG